MTNENTHLWERCLLVFLDEIDRMTPQIAKIKESEILDYAEQMKQSAAKLVQARLLSVPPDQLVRYITGEMMESFALKLNEATNVSIKAGTNPSFALKVLREICEAKLAAIEDKSPPLKLDPNQRN